MPAVAVEPQPVKTLPEAPARLLRHDPVQRLDDLPIALRAYVPRLIPCLRTISAIGTPASPSFKIATICDSVNLDFFISSPVSPRESIINCVRDGGAYAFTRQASQVQALYRPPLQLRVSA